MQVAVPILEANMRLLLTEVPCVLSASDGVHSLLGFERGEFLSSAVTLAGRIHPDDADIAAMLFSHEKANSDGTFNLRIRHAEGRILCMRGQFSQKPREDGKVVLDLLLHDARSLCHRSQALAGALSFDAKADTTGQFLYFKDRNHVFTWASQTPGGLRNGGEFCTSLPGKTDYDVFSEEYADVSYRMEREVFAGSPSSHAVQETLSNDGKKCWFDIRKHPVRDEQGIIVGLWGVETDITRQKLSEEALRTSEARCRSLLESASDGIFVVNDHFRFVEVNSACCRMLGYSREEMLALSVPHIGCTEEPVRIALENTLLSLNQPIRGDWLLTRKNGSRFLAELSAHRLPDGCILATARDVSQQRSGELELRRSEASMMAAETRAHLGSWELDLTSMSGHWSAENSRLYYRDPFPGQLTFADCLELVHPEDRAKCQKDFRRILETAEPFEFEYRTNPASGPVRLLSTTAYPIRNDRGEAVRMEGTTLDITGRRRAEEALRESEASLKDAQVTAGLGKYVLDAASRTWTSSQELDVLFGIDSSYERTVAGWMALIHPDDRALFEACIAESHLGHGGQFEDEYRIIRHSDGELRWVHGISRPVFDAQGRLVRKIGTTQDITSRKLAEIALRDSEESLKETQRLAGLGSYIFDIPSGTWTSSEVMDEVFGIPKGETRLVDEWLEIIHPDHRAMMAAYLTDHVIGQGKPFDKEYRFVRQCDRAERWAHGTGRLEFDAQGQPSRMLGAIQDITERKLVALALEESQKLLELFIQHAPVSLAMFDRDMRYLSVSQRWLEDFAIVGREVIGQSHYDILPDIPERLKRSYGRGLQGETIRADEDLFERADGTATWLRWEVRPWRLGDGSVGGILIFSENITQNKLAEERLRLAATVFTHAREGILITASDGSILDVNAAFSLITGYSRDEVLDRNPRMFSSGLQDDDFYQRMWRDLEEKGQWYGEIWNRKKDGQLFAALQTISKLSDVNGKVTQFLQIFSDITVMKENERKLEHIAHFDLLTGLPNRVLLADRMHQAMVQSRRRGQMLAVAYLDLDGFKNVNDAHGHEAGDHLLATLASRMKQALREGDTLARLGGDEFVAVLIDLPDSDACLPELSRLLEAAASAVPYGELELRVSASLGVTFYPQADEEVDADQLLRQADQAMYQAKLAGRNRYHIFDSSQDRSVRGHHENLEQIHQALTANQFVLFYQPKVNMATGEFLGAEALIRWQHPQRGLLPPGIFLPVIEDHPLAVDLGEWVIETALAQMESWKAAGSDIAVSVNIGAYQLQKVDFVDRLRSLLEMHPAIHPSKLELEVLETSALQDVSQVSRAIVDCRKIGVSVALDDFGTGYSSLAYLKRLPANVLKIDQSFIRDMLEDSDDLAILEGVLGLAVAFRRQVIAEGVETVGQGVMLLQLGCERAQGYCIARPMPAGDLPRWIENWRPALRWAGVSSIGADNWPTLHAGVELRAWVAAVEHSLADKLSDWPEMDEHQCRFGAWLDAEKTGPRSTLPAFRDLEMLHGQLHQAVAEVAELREQGNLGIETVLIHQLHALRDQILDYLAALTLRTPSRSKD